MAYLNEQRTCFSSWKVAKFLWAAQALSSLFFGIPLVGMVLFAANINPLVIQKIILLYLSISFFVYIPFNGILSFVLLNSPKKTLNKIYEKGKPAPEELRVVGKFLNLPLRFSLIVFFSSFLGFIFGLFILWLGLIPELMALINMIIFLGLAVGFAACVIQVFLAYIFLENYFRDQIEKLPLFYLKTTKEMKIKKIPFSWKIFFLTFFSVTVAQVSLGSLYLGRVIMDSSTDVEKAADIKKALIYVGIVIILTLIYIVIVTIAFSKNLISPLKKIIIWADKITKGETKEEIFVVANDELLEVIECLKQMHEELESNKASLEIKIKARTRELEELTERQEEVIQERIKEVQERAEELERFQKLAVGRELKMIELKKEINKLKKTL